MTSFNVCDRKGLKIYRNIILKKVILSILLILLFALLSTSASAADFYSDYGQSEILYETVSSGSYNFEVNGMPASERWTEWYVNGSYTGEQYDDRSYWLNAYYDPDYTYSFSRRPSENSIAGKQPLWK